jgi:predicted PurR-regulated permease PerM
MYGPTERGWQAAHPLMPKPTADTLYAVLVVVLALWILHSFLLSVLLASVVAIASWPLYERFAARATRRIGPGATSLLFTTLMTLFVLAPLMFALAALVNEVRALVLDLISADTRGIAVPAWLPNVPLAGPWLAERWQRELASPGALGIWAQRNGSEVVVGLAHSLGQFVARHLMIIGIAILLLFSLYRQGASLARHLARWLRHRIGARAERHVELATRAVRASVNSMLVVALFDGCAAAGAYAIVGVPHAAVWAAIIASLALVPFLGYAGVAALALQLAVSDGPSLALLALALGCVILFCGDKIVRPAVARDGTRLGFVWVLLGCFGGFQALGLVGVVVGPVVLTLARELWLQRMDEFEGPRPQAGAPDHAQESDLARTPEPEVAAWVPDKSAG